jgi:glucose-6-phosphate isomerase
MRTLHDLLSSWPALDVTSKHARLVHAPRVRAEQLDEAVESSVPAAATALAALWRRDSSLWSRDEATRKKIDNRLGWLQSPELMADSIGRLNACAQRVKDEGFTDIVLLGMGGSSLAPEVLHQLIGGAPGWPRFRMLDSTDPAAVLAAETTPERTLYVLSSKSGTTIEPNSLAAHFRARLESRGLSWGNHFIAITDEGTELARLAVREGFRDVFINPSDIGGRYSAVSFFGLVPAALMGQDIEQLIAWSLAMLAVSSPLPDVPPDKHPAASLGLLIGTAARAGRDKLTLVVPPGLEAFGLWVEQLIAESTGKQGTGVIPIAGESLAGEAEYGADRIFVRLRPGESWRARLGLDWNSYESSLSALERTGAPMVDIEIDEPAALGAEFIRWEIATALVGAMLGINPFDEPNVQQAKDATRTLLDRYTTEKRLPHGCAERALPGGIGLELTSAARTALGSDRGEAILTLLGHGDYLALLAYLGPDEQMAAALQALRNEARNRTRAATMFGYGPRYLHSTGQLHKGGPNSGVFVLMTADAARDVPIPDAPYSFGTLELAQALGDFNSLEATGRRALHVHLPRQDADLVKRVSDALLAALDR